MEKEQTLQLANCEITRLDVDDEHYYFGKAPGGLSKYYLSLTRVLDIGAPFPEGLRQYLRMSSFEEQKDRLEFTGARGTKLHQALDTLMRGGVQLNLATDFTSSYEKDALVTFIRMMRFLNPTKFKTELTVADPALRVAGTTDFAGWVDNWKLEALLKPTHTLELDSDSDLQLVEAHLGLPEKHPGRSRVIIDWKFTGRSTYSHKVQVAAYKTMYNMSHKGRASRAFTWRYSPRHKHGFDFGESVMDYGSFKRIYATTVEYLEGFPEPPTLRVYPEKVMLWEKKG